MSHDAHCSIVRLSIVHCLLSHVCNLANLFIESIYRFNGDLVRDALIALHLVLPSDSEDEGSCLPCDLTECFPGMTVCYKILFMVTVVYGTVYAC